MLLTLVIIIALIGAAVIGNIYSNFLVFHSNFAETDNYHKAYYTSIAALERGELVTKQRQPGYVGSGGRIMDQSIGTYYNGASDGIIDEGFSYLSKDSNKLSTVYRNVDSLTNRIPKEGAGDIDRMLSTGDSSDFNTMNYNDSEVFLLYRDPSNDNPYLKFSEKNMVKSKESSVNITIRLPGYLYNTFEDLDTTKSVVGNNIKNDAIIDRQVMGKMGDKQYTIFSTQRTSPNGLRNNDYDTEIRESDINNSNGVTLNFSGTKDPFRGTNNRTIISSQSSDITNFSQIFNDSKFSHNQMRFSLLNKLKNVHGAIYPFLEYFIEFNEEAVPDKYYTINAEGNYGDYQINLIIQKPTIKESILQSFTTIF